MYRSGLRTQARQEIQASRLAKGVQLTKRMLKSKGICMSASKKRTIDRDLCGRLLERGSRRARMIASLMSSIWMNTINS
jgi:hypothetical protein